MAHVRGREPHGEDDRCDEPERRDRPPAPRERGDHGRADEERDEARLGEREEEPDPGGADRGRGGERNPRVRPEHDQDQAGQDRHSEKAPVDRRVVEDRVDPVERRVGVADDHLRVPEDVPRHVLVDADHGEHGRHRGELCVEEGRPAPVPGQSGEADREQPEGKPEREQGDRALPEVFAPGQREAAPGHERGERVGERAELARALVASRELPGEKQGAGDDDPVERDQQVGVRRADVHRDPRRHAGERGHREQPRPAAKQDGRGACEPDSQHRCSDEQRAVAVRSQVGHEQDAAERPQGEPGRAQVTARGDEEEREARSRDRPTCPGELTGDGAPLLASRAGRSRPPVASVRRNWTRSVSSPRPHVHDRAVNGSVRADQQLEPAGAWRRPQDEQPGPRRPAAGAEPPAELRRIGLHADAEARARLDGDLVAGKLDEAGADDNRLRRRVGAGLRRGPLRRPVRL